MPVILLASGYKTMTLLYYGMPVDWGMLTLAVIVSAVVAYLAIEFFMRVVNAIGLMPFVIYRLILAGVIVYVLV